MEYYTITGWGVMVERGIEWKQYQRGKGGWEGGGA